MRNAAIVVLSYASCDAGRAPSTKPTAAEKPPTVERSTTDICAAFDVSAVGAKLGWPGMRLKRRSTGPYDSIVCEFTTPDRSEHALVAQFIPGSIDPTPRSASGVPARVEPPRALPDGSVVFPRPPREFDELDLPDGTHAFVRGELNTTRTRALIARNGLVISTQLDGIESPRGMQMIAAATHAIADTLPPNPRALIDPPRPQ